MSRPDQFRPDQFRPDQFRPDQFRPDQFRPDQLRIDRFVVANAEFWLSMTARWLAEPGNADRFSEDLWAGQTFPGSPVQAILADAAARLRHTLSDPDATIDAGGSW